MIDTVGSSESGPAAAGTGGAGDSGAGGAAGTEKADSSSADADGATDSGSTTADTGNATDSGSAVATEGGAPDASVDGPADAPSAEGGASCGVAQIVASGPVHETNILVRRIDGTVSMYQESDSVGTGGTLVHDTSAHFREILWADQTPMTASDVVIGSVENSTSVIGCGLFNGNVWCFHGGAVNSVLLGGGFGPYDMLYWPVKVVIAVGGPPLANAQQLAGEGWTNGPAFCALTVDGSIWCWGKGFYGQLGRGDQSDGAFARPVLADATTPFSSAAEVRLGWQTACARKTDGSVWCWGQNSWGEIPSLPKQPAPYPVQISLPGSGDQAISTRLISVADRTWCSIMKDTSVVCWGLNDAAQSGLPVDPTVMPPAISVAPPTRILTSMAGPPLEGVLDLSFEGNEGRTCARTSSLDVVCWGNRHPYAQPYFDDTQTAVSNARVPLAATYNGLVYVDAKGLVRSDGTLLQSQPCAPPH